MMEKGKTKIVATIGPASESEDMIRSLIAKGVDVARLNTKHNEPFWHMKMIGRIRRISKSMGMTVGILLDLQGPEIRAENFMAQPIKIIKGATYHLTSKKPQKENEIHIPFENVIESLKKDDTLSLHDGGISFLVTSVRNGVASLMAEEDYVLGHRKTINIPGLSADIPSLTERDKEYLEIIKKEPVDFIGLSFVRSKRDLEILRKHLDDSKSTAKIIAKVETRLALKNIDEIIKETDVLMIARGDLGVENPIEEIAYWQKKLIRLCREKNTPVIVATQMLKSMVDSPTPTRAEATDIANAVFDGTDAIMLSEETAMGTSPERAVSAMARIAHFNEGKHELFDNFIPTPLSPTEVFANAAAGLIEQGSKFALDKVIVFTESGYTARALATYRPKYGIIAVTDRQATANQLSMVFGIKPYLTKFPNGPVTLENIPIKKLIAEKLINKGDTVLIMHGKKWKQPGTSSVLAFLKV
jgi:pyruvate kinase